MNGTGRDFSGMGNNGSLVGAATYSSGRVGGGLFLNNNTNYFEIPNPGTLLTGNTASCSAWVMVTNAANTYPRVIDRTYNSQFAFYIAAGTVPIIVSGAYNATGGATDFAGGGVAGTFISTNVWVNVVWVLSIPTLTVYTNGVLSGSSTGGTTGTFASSSSVIRIGQRADAGGNRGFVGWIDDVRLWNRVLTSVEVQQIYNGGYGR
jgi:hypothetical protein